MNNALALTPLQFSKSNVEKRAFYAAHRIFGRYGVNVADPNVSGNMFSAAMKRMTAREYECVINAFGAVMGANGKLRHSTPVKKTEAQMYDDLQARAYHLKNHREDLPKPKKMN